MGETLALNVQMQKKGKEGKRRRKPWAPFVWHFYALSPLGLRLWQEKAATRTKDRERPSLVQQNTS